jgi:hypothetical protein
MKSHTGLRRFICLISLTLFLSHCQKKDETPPPPKAEAPPAESPVPEPFSAPSTVGQVGQARLDCCGITPAAGLKEGMGRIVVNYPGDAKPLEARVDIYKPGDSKALNGGYGNQTIELLPGTYDIVINGQRVTGVSVQAGHETHVNVGVLHVYADKKTRIDLLDPGSGTVLTGGYGEKSYGLPIGQVSVQVAGQSETVTIEQGKVTDF